MKRPEHPGETLERFRLAYDFNARVSLDPIEFPGRYRNPADIEAAGFIAASFAYGRVGLFKPVIGMILSQMGESPADFLGSFDPKNRRSLFEGISYRFNRNDDIIAFLSALGSALRHYGSIERLFALRLESGNPSVRDGISGMAEYFLSLDTSPAYGKNLKPHGYRQFFPSPGGACKRTNLFLRWMVRTSPPDFGIWKIVSPKDLVIPLDTHISRISRCLGLTGRKSDDWRTAVEITENLKVLDPDDPLKYDFALCHFGISQECGPARCNGCEMNPRNLSVTSREKHGIKRLPSRPS